MSARIARRCASHARSISSQFFSRRGADVLSYHLHVCTNKGKWSREESEQLPCAEEEGAGKMEILLSALKGGDTNSWELIVRVLREV